METRQLRYALALAETLHFGRTAEKFYIAQSAFSSQIARLEKEVGARLFERSNKGVTITQAGEAFLKRAEGILDQVDSASREAASIQAAQDLDLRIGLFYDSAGEMTPLIVDTYRRAFPEVKLSFRELSMENQVSAVVNREVDVAFLRAPLHDSHIEMTNLFSEPRYAGLSSRNSLAQKTELTTADLIDEGFALASPLSPESWRGYWTFDDFRDGPSRVVTTVRNVWESVNSIIYENAVDTFPGTCTRMHQPSGLVYRKITDATYATIALAIRRGGLPSHVQAFREVALDLCRTSLDVVPGAVLPEFSPRGTPL